MRLIETRDTEFILVLKRQIEYLQYGSKYQKIFLKSFQSSRPNWLNFLFFYFTQKHAGLTAEVLKLICWFRFNWIIKNTLFLLVKSTLVHRNYFVLKAFSEQVIYKTHVTGYLCFSFCCYFWVGTCLLRFTA